MSERLPQGFGPFQLLHRVAVGATAQLFAATRASEPGLGPVSIVKRFPPNVGVEPPRNYLTEVHLGQRLDHPALVSMSDFGQEGDCPWIEMEWVEGKSLRQLMRKLSRGRRKLPMSLAIYIAREVCRALDALHRLRAEPDGPPLLHGDLSPGNVLLGYDGIVKLGDFGDVRPIGALGDIDAPRPKGQLRYLSPEHVLGEPLTQASDLFSLGAVLHEMLTGQPLFVAGTEAILLTRVKGAEVDPPSLANPDIPPALDRLVMSALAPYPDERPTSVRAFWLTLSEFDGEGDTEADRDLLARVMRKLFERERQVERSRLSNAMEDLREPPPPESEQQLEDAVSAVRSIEEPPAPAPRRRSRMSLALLSPFEGGGLEAVVVPEIPRALPEPVQPPPALRTAKDPNSNAPRIVQRPNPRAQDQAAQAPPAPPPTLGMLAPPPAAPAAPPRPPEDQPSPTGSAAALLIVDSDADAREHFGRQFRKAGYHVDLADGGVSAMDKVFDRNYDLVLMATRMPRPNGVQVLKGLRRTWSAPELPVILTATQQRSQDVLKALSLGANDLVSKGIEFNVLHARVRTQIMLKLTYEALQATEARYDALVDHSSDMVFHLSPRGRVAFVSPASRAMLGYSPQSLVGRSLFTLIHKPDVERLRELALPGEILPEGDDFTVRMMHRDRSLLWVLCQLRITRDRRTGAIAEIHGTCREQPPDSIGDDLPPDEVAMRVEPGVELGPVAEALTQVGLAVVQGPGGPNDLRVVPLNRVR